MDKFQIRPDPAAHLAERKAWLKAAKTQPLEEMSDFFSARLEGYEAHMQLWQPVYRALPDLLPPACEDVLDLGCGTGLELGPLFEAFPALRVTAVDLCAPMLEKLEERFPAVCALKGDYLRTDYPPAAFDAVISVESFHHLWPEQKAGLYQKLFHTLRPGGRLVLADYLACCPEEEELLAEACRKLRVQQGIPADRQVHFDLPLTPEHECSLLRAAGFTVRLEDCYAGAVLLTARRPAP